MSLPPIDLTLPANAYADLSIFALVPVPRSGFATLKKSLPTLAPNPTVPQILSFRTPSDLLRLYQGVINFFPPTSIQNSAWTKAIGNQTYGILHPLPQFTGLHQLYDRLNRVTHGDSYADDTNYEPRSW